MAEALLINYNLTHVLGGHALAIRENVHCRHLCPGGYLAILCSTEYGELNGDDQFLVASLGVLNPQSKPYLDPWSGAQFGEGGVEQHLALKPHEEVVRGSPIMQKLGNETAK